METSTKMKVIDKMDNASMYIFMGCLMVTLLLTATYKAQYPHGVPIELIAIVLSPVLIAGAIVFIFHHLYWNKKESVTN